MNFHGREHLAMECSPLVQRASPAHSRFLLILAVACVTDNEQELNEMEDSCTAVIPYYCGKFLFGWIVFSTFRIYQFILCAFSSQILLSTETSIVVVLSCRYLAT